MQDRRKQTKGGFTLIELLTVIAIIALLIAVLSVGTRKVKIISKGLQQKSVFHAMSVGLELFSGDFDGYPRSSLTHNSGAAPYVTGAQHLIEAMVGRDERGFEPLTGWYPPDDTIYKATAPADLYTNVDQSLSRRKGPYSELKYGQLLTIFELYSGNNGSSGIYDSAGASAPKLRAPILTDVFNRNDSPAGRVGMPILYFKADPTMRFRVDQTRQTVTNPTAVQYRDWVYNFDDNLPILQLPWLRDTTQTGMSVHYKDPDNSGKNQAQVFYEQITQQANPGQNFYKPYNSSTFLLISAGWDGVFGTRDDVINFD